MLNLKDRLYGGALFTPIALAILLAWGADAPIPHIGFSSLILCLVAVGLLSLKVRFTRNDFFGFLCFATLASFSLYKGWLFEFFPEYISLLAGLGLIFIGQNLASSYERGIWLWTYLLRAVGVIALISLLHYAINPGSWFGQDYPYHLNRLSGPFLSANTAATIFGFFFLSFWIFLKHKSEKIIVSTRILKTTIVFFEKFSIDIIFALSCFACLVLTASRAANLIVFLIAIVIFIWPSKTHNGQFKKLKYIITIALFIFCLTAYSLSETLINRAHQIPDALPTRLTMFQAYINGLQLAPFMGNGLGSFDIMNAMTQTQDNAPILWNQGAAHNLVLQWLLQAGFVYTSLFFCYWLFIIRDHIKARKSVHRGQYAINASIAGLILVFAHGLVDYGMEIPGAFWLIALSVGLTLGLARRRTRSVKLSRPQNRLSVFLLLGLILTFASFSVPITQGQLKARELISIGAISRQNTDSLQFNPFLPSSYYRHAAYLIISDNGPTPSTMKYLQYALKANPRDGQNWLYYSYAQSRNGEENTSMISSLEYSYIYQPYFQNRQIRRFRLNLVARYWEFLPDHLRNAALREAQFLRAREKAEWEELI